MAVSQDKEFQLFLLLLSSSAYDVGGKGNLATFPVSIRNPSPDSATLPWISSNILAEIGFEENKRTNNLACQRASEIEAYNGDTLY
jgi:hypothetical protein